MTSLTLALLLGAAVQPPPDALPRLEAAVEEAGDAALSGRWQEARRFVSEAEASAPAPLEARLAGLDRLVALREGLAAAYAANDLADDVVDLYAPYDTSEPLDLRHLAVDLREVRLDARSGQLDAARDPFALAQDAWDRLEDDAALAGTELGPLFQKQLDELGNAVAGGDPALMERAAAAALDRVDELEVAYRRR